MVDVCCIGEALIDFLNIKDNLFEANCGGGPANVAVAVSRFNKKAGLISKVGNDIFGKMIRDTLQNENVDVTNLVLTDDYFTTLAFVKLNEEGERSFSFARKFSADLMLKKEEIDTELIKKSRLLHFSSLLFTHEICKEAVYAAINIAKAHNVLISYDPNYRPLLWDSFDKAKKEMIKPIESGYVDILKISDDEALIYANSIDEFINKYKEYMKIIFITRGKKGSVCYYKGAIFETESFDVTTIDTTGCGDCFMGAMLAQLCDKDIDNIDLNKLKEMVIISNAAGALCATKKGAISAIPAFNKVLEFVKSRNATQNI